ncbi:MAG: hypothetical protein ABMA15_26710 [Vicinamibacterales bacterium]
MTVSAPAAAVSAVGSSPLAPPRLRPMQFDDYPAVQRLEAEHDLITRSTEEWTSLLVDNPLWSRVGSHWPIGWVFEAGAGKLVGSVTNIPLRYHLGGRELTCANGRAWVVANEYRSFALWLMDEYFNQPGVDLFVNTTVGPTAQETHTALSARVPLGDWESAAYWVTGYRGFARNALERLNVPLARALAFPAALALWTKDAVLAGRLPEPPGSVAVEETDHFDARFDTFWEELLRQNPDKLLAARDRQTLTWHFAHSMRRGRLWIITASRGGVMRAYVILKRQDLSGGLRRLRLIDYQTLESDVDLLPCLIRESLRRCAAEGVYLLEHFGCGLPKMRAFDQLAPYRSKVKTWAYFGHAVDPGLDSALRRPEVWDPSMFDGDASFE